MKTKFGWGLYLVAGLVLLAGAAQAGPQLTIRDAEFDFGFAPQNSKVAHVFWLHNTGDDSLIIEKVIPG